MCCGVGKINNCDTIVYSCNDTVNLSFTILCVYYNNPNHLAGIHQNNSDRQMKRKTSKCSSFKSEDIIV